MALNLKLILFPNQVVKKKDVLGFALKDLI